MLYVSIFVELLRSRPALTVWFAALAQATLWTLIPTLFYAGPPGDVPFVLAVGHEWQLGSWLGPPLAFWLAEGAFVLAGNRLFGVYLLSQICVVVTCWAVFALGRAIVGAQHAALAVLAMAGILAFTLPTPEFGPAILAMALWSLILLHYWLAISEGRRGYWLALAVEIGLLLLTTYAGLLLIGVLALFTALDRRARAAIRSTDALLAGLVVIVVVFPHLLWLWDAGQGLTGRLMQLRGPDSLFDSAFAVGRQIGFLAVAHAGLAMLVLAVIGFRMRGEPVPVIARAPVPAFARQFVLYFAIAPAVATTIVTAPAGWVTSLGGVAPLLVLSGLAAVTLAGNAIALRRQHVAIAAWFAVLLAPPVLAVFAVLLLPWLGIDLEVNKPAKEMARFFSESFQRRTGMPLQIVAGDPRSAALIAFGSPSRPSLLLDATPEWTPWVIFEDVRKNGAVLIWPTADTAGTPPPALKERFPDLVPDATTRAFDHQIRGRLPPLRYGWAVIRPQTDGKGQNTDEGKK